MAFDKEKTLAAAQKYADKDQHEKAIREFQKILDVEPKRPPRATADSFEL